MFSLGLEEKFSNLRIHKNCPQDMFKNTGGCDSVPEFLIQ